VIWPRRDLVKADPARGLLTTRKVLDREEPTAENSASLRWALEPAHVEQEPHHQGDDLRHRWGDA